jgi:hypothetical protein
VARCVGGGAGIGSICDKQAGGAKPSLCGLQVLIVWQPWTPQVWHAQQVFISHMCSMLVGSSPLTGPCWAVVAEWSGCQAADCVENAPTAGLVLVKVRCSSRWGSANQP